MILRESYEEISQSVIPLEQIWGQNEVIRPKTNMTMIFKIDSGYEYLFIY